MSKRMKTPEDTTLYVALVKEKQPNFDETWSRFSLESYNLLHLWFIINLFLYQAGTV